MQLQWQPTALVALESLTSNQSITHASAVVISQP